jgi:hypothetical protein
MSENPTESDQTSGFSNSTNHPPVTEGFTIPGPGWPTSALEQMLIND